MYGHYRINESDLHAFRTVCNLPWKTLNSFNSFLSTTKKVDFEDNYIRLHYLQEWHSMTSTVRQIFNVNMRFPDEYCYVLVPTLGKLLANVCKALSYRTTDTKISYKNAEETPQLAAVRAMLIDMIFEIQLEFTKPTNKSVFDQSRFESQYNLVWVKK